MDDLTDIQKKVVNERLTVRIEKLDPEMRSAQCFARGLLGTFEES